MKLETTRITAADVQGGKYKGGDLITAGRIEIAPDLGCVAFGKLVAGGAIKAGEWIKAGGDIKAQFRIFAGLTGGRLPTADEMTITCGRLLGGKVAHGHLVQRA